MNENAPQTFYDLIELLQTNYYALAVTTLNDYTKSFTITLSPWGKNTTILAIKVGTKDKCDNHGSIASYFGTKNAAFDTKTCELQIVNPQANTLVSGDYVPVGVIHNFLRAYERRFNTR